MLGRRGRGAARGQRRGTPADLLVVGLGNPGKEFTGSRHNAGAEAVVALAARHHGRLRPEKGLFAEVADVRIAGKRVLLAVPTTFMNESGRAVAPLVRRAGVDQPRTGDDGRVPEGDTLAQRLIVVHDELDLPPGRVKIKAGGGTAGNNGLKSIERHLHTNEYLRVRVGIGKPPGSQSGADYVLRPPGVAERTLFSAALDQAADAVEAIAAEGVASAMNTVNVGAGPG